MPAKTASSDRPRRRIGATLWLLGLLPVGMHFGLVAMAIGEHGRLRFDVFDLVVTALVCAYLVVLALSYGTRRGAAKFLVATYSFLVAFLLANYLLLPPAATPTRAPWVPRRTVATVANTMPGIEGEVSFNVNRLGLRGPDVTLDDVDVRILCVGGSTTECFYVTDEKSWPWLLQTTLSERLSRPVFVGNSGQSGAMALHHEYLLEHYPPAPRFQWVVLFCGINDVWAFLNHTYDERRKLVPQEALLEMPKVYYRRLAAFEFLRKLHMDRQLANKLARASSVVVRDLQGEWYDAVRARRKALLLKQTFVDVPATFERALEQYRRDLTRIVQLCRTRGQDLVMLTQPTMYRKDLPDRMKGLIWAHGENGAYSLDVLERVMDGFNRAMREVCEREKVDCIDLAAAIPKDTTALYDDCHLNIAGCAAVAESLSAYLTTRLGR